MIKNQKNLLTFIVDIDGTLCPIKKADEQYENIIPHKNMVHRLHEYHKMGARIVLFTSRNMNTYDGNIGLINAHTAKILLSWLDKWQIPYDEIIYGKPWPGQHGFYVDDRSVRPDEFLKYSTDELTMICNKSKEILE